MCEYDWVECPSFCHQFWSHEKGRISNRYLSSFLIYVPGARKSFSQHLKWVVFSKITKNKDSIFGIYAMSRYYLLKKMCLCKTLYDLKLTRLFHFRRWSPFSELDISHTRYAGQILTELKSGVAKVAADKNLQILLSLFGTKAWFVDWKSCDWFIQPSNGKP